MANVNIRIQTNSGTVDTAKISVSATLKGITKSATLTVTPPATPPSVASISIQPASFVGGSAPNIDVFLNEPAPFDGANVTLTSSDPATLTLASPMNISQGSLSGQEIATTVAVHAKTTVTVTASYGGQTVSATATILPPPKVRVASLTLNPFHGRGWKLLHRNSNDHSPSSSRRSDGADGEQ